MNIRILELRNEYLTSFSGQNNLVDIVNQQQDCEKVIEFDSETDNIPCIIAEAKSSHLTGDNPIEKGLVDLFTGNENFQYPYTYWEIDMNIENPSKEQIAAHIVENWYEPVDASDTEEIESIMEMMMYGFHDCYMLRTINPERTSELATLLTKKAISDTLTKLRDELENNGIIIDSLTNSDFKLFDDIMKLVTEAANNQNGLIYVIETW